MDGYLFRSDDLKRKVRSLSGGERNRLLLARLMLQGANFLVMDEPTNDLDHDTLGVLEEILMDQEGCCLISSHDQRFLDPCCDSDNVFGSSICCIIWLCMICSMILQQTQVREIGL